jgi:hypothetical protein
MHMTFMREAAKTAAIVVTAAGMMHFAKAEPWHECASRAVEVKEYGRAIMPSEDFLMPHDHEKRMEKVWQADRDIKEGRVPAYVLGQCGPKPDEK